MFQFGFRVFSAAQRFTLRSHEQADRKAKRPIHDRNYSRMQKQVSNCGVKKLTRHSGIERRAAKIESKTVQSELQAQGARVERN